MAGYRVPEWNVEALQEEIAKLNKRALKLGCPAITCTIQGWETKTVESKRVKGLMIEKRWALIDIEGSVPVLAGWRFIAKIEPTEAGNLIQCVPGADDTIPMRFRDTDMSCDHCKTNRARSNVFVLRNQQTGNYVQVGRSCIVDFLGGTTPEQYAQMAELELLLASVAGDSEDDEWGSGGGGAYAVDKVKTPEFVATVAAFARQFGWVSRAASEHGGGEPTSGRAWFFIFPWSPKAQQEKDEFIAKTGFEVQERDIVLSQKALDWAQALDPGNNNFLYNLQVASKRIDTDHKTRGIIAAVVGAYMREVEKTELARPEVKRSTEYVGTVGKREVFSNLTVLNFREFDDDYGVRTMIKFSDEAGNALVWWTGPRPHWVEQGQVVTIKATVKKQEPYREEIQTTITRAAFVS